MTFLCALCILAGAFAVTDPNQRPTTRVTDCTSSGCHAEQMKFTYLHAPAAVGACEICHLYEDPAKHSFKLIVKHQDEPICSFCHIGKSTFGRGDNWVGMHVHEPVREGDCVGCHNPHGSNMRNLINAESIPGLCSSCHDGKLDQKHMHPPVGDGHCLSCHTPHAGEFKSLLHQPGRDLCLSCHSDVLPPGVIGGEQGWGGQSRFTTHLPLNMLAAIALPAGHAPVNRAGAADVHIHEPALGECSECHNPHGSPHKAMLNHDVQMLCTSCHEDVARGIANSTVHHSPVTDDRACLNCHLPHHSPHTALLAQQPMALCVSCHQQPQKRPDGSRIESVTALFKGAYHHGPITPEGGNCSSCHDLHGGTRRSLLTADYSDELYQSFKRGSFELCFSCHDPALATEQHTTTATKFRDGDLNLHYVHVTAPGDSGRSCRFCHDTHSSNSTRMMRESVPYGQWQLPITFQSNANGGSCGAGCHREREYRRE